MFVVSSWWVFMVKYCILMFIYLFRLFGVLIFFIDFIYFVGFLFLWLYAECMIFKVGSKIVWIDSLISICSPLTMDFYLNRTENSFHFSNLFNQREIDTNFLRDFWGPTFWSILGSWLRISVIAAERGRSPKNRRGKRKISLHVKMIIWGCKVK